MNLHTPASIESQNDPEFDLEKYKAFLRNIDFSLESATLEAELQEFTVSGYYPTAVLVEGDNLFSKLLPDRQMDDSKIIGGDGYYHSSHYFFNYGRFSGGEKKIDRIIAISAYKALPVISTETTEQVEAIINA